MKSILVTGGCGFIGSNFIRLQLAEYSDVHVINVDSLTYAGNPENLSDVADHPRYSFYKADITDAEAIREILRTERPDARAARRVEGARD